MNPLHIALIAGGALLLLRRKTVAQETQPAQLRVTPEPIYAPGGKAVELEPVQVTALRPEKPIPFPTSFQYEQMPERPVSQSTGQSIMKPVFGSISLAQHFIREECEKRGGYWSRSGCIGARS